MNLVQRIRKVHGKKMNELLYSGSLILPNFSKSRLESSNQAHNLSFQKLTPRQFLQ
jgi:hypothetical protein